MIEELLTLIGVIKQIGYFTLLLSFKTGQLIVYGIQATLDFLTSITTSLWSGLVIITEDFGIFVLDLYSSLEKIVQVILNSVDNAASTLFELIYLFQNGLENIVCFILAIYNGILHVLTRVFIFSSNVLNGIKYFFVLFGQGVWFAVTIIPLSIAYLCISTTYVIGRLFEEFSNIVYLICANISELFYNIYQFVTDVPVESLAGLMIAICLSYVLIKCHIILFKFLRNMINNLIIKCQAKFTFTLRNETDNNIKNGTCVICFERSKCLLTMPCRHLCMCVECWEQLQRYQYNNETKSCPVCRKSVQYTIHVY